MRQFSSYGPIDTDLYYYAPRKELIDKAVTQLTGEKPVKGGHYEGGRVSTFDIRL